MKLGNKGSGKVYLVGAGPGDERLISVRGLELIREADVLIYDRLAGKGLFQETKADCEKINVGKKPGCHTMRQSEINALLIEKAKQGGKIVRLKGGDPFIFGRGGEEAEELRNNGIAFEIIPGISSFYSSCAYSGIPVTYRQYAASFHVFTGHSSDGKKLDFQTIAKLEGTLVFLMGMKHLEEIVNGLLEYGKLPATPAAIIQWGTTAKQREVVGTLITICRLAEEAKLSNPSIIVIGEVVTVKEKIYWRNMLPLHGKRILITREIEEGRELAKKLSDLGAEAISFPVTKIQTPQNRDALDMAIDTLKGLNNGALSTSEKKQYTWLFFTSVNGVAYFFNRMAEKQADIRLLAGIKIFCIGTKTEAAVQAKGLFADFVPQEHNSSFAAKEIQGFLTKRDRVLYPTSNAGGKTLQAAIEASGAKCDLIVAYETVPCQDIDCTLLEEIEQGSYDAAAVFSGSQARNFMHITKGKTGNLKICAIGKATASAAEEVGLQIHGIANDPSIDGMVDAIMDVIL